MYNLVRYNTERFMDMTKREKLIERLMQRPSNFEYDEARTLLPRLGYSEETRGCTSL